MVEYLRLWRKSTDTYLTYKLNGKCSFEEACQYIDFQWPGWEVLCGSLENLDGCEQMGEWET